MDLFNKLTKAYKDADDNKIDADYSPEEQAGRWLTRGSAYLIYARNLEGQDLLAQKLARQAMDEGGKEAKIALALNVSDCAAGWQDEPHHLRWAIAQMSHSLLGDDYDAWVERINRELDEYNDSSPGDRDNDLFVRRWNPGRCWDPGIIR